MRTRLRPDIILCTCILIAYGCLTFALNAAASATPYGVDAMTWRSAPDGMKTLKPGQVVTLPRDAMDVDVWTVRNGRSHYRLRQRLDRSCAGCTQWAFTPARSRRTYAGYVGINRDVFSFTKKTVLRVYWWRG